jgi:tripartite-type tricarboxylate transporter receptor subunit TctC
MSTALPEIPSVAEFVPGYEASNWFGVGAPKATPAETVEKLNEEITLASPILKSRRSSSPLGSTTHSHANQVFRRFVS